MTFKENVVSIVVPVYNGEKFIGRLLGSVLLQTWKELEIIISDDGSTDDTVKTVEDYRERFENSGISFTLVKNPHVNASSAVSAALKYVTGEFLIWPDSDDELLPDSIEKRVTFLNDHSKFGAVRSLGKYINESDGSEAGRDEELGNLSKTKLFFEILNGNTFVCCGCYMLRSSLFFDIYKDRSIPIYDVGQNFQMLLPYCYKHECATINEELYIVYKHAGSHSRRALSKEQEYKKYSAYESLIDELAEISGIKDVSELKAIAKWKYDRRLKLARKYDDDKMTRDTIRLMYKEKMLGKLGYTKKYLLTFKPFKIIHKMIK